MIIKKLISAPTAGLSVLLLLALVPASPRAQSGEADQRDAAETDSETPPSEQAPAAETSFSALVERALNHYKNGDYEAAIRDLTVAYRKKSKARLLFNLGMAYDKRGDCAGALVYFRSYLKQKDTEKRLVERADKFLDDADECDGYSEDLAGRLTLYSSPSGARVEVDGRARGTTPVELVGLSADTHTVRLEHPARASVEFDVELTAGDDHEIERTLPAEPATTEKTDDATDDETDAPAGPRFADRFTPLKPTAVALGSTGAGLLLTGTIVDFALLTQTNRKLRVLPADSESYARYRSRRTTERVFAHIGYLGGLTLVGAGIAWQLWGPTPVADASASSSGPTWRIGLSPRKVTLRIRFR